MACMGERRGAYGILVGKPRGKRPLGRPKHKWENNGKMYSYNKSQQDALFLNFILIKNFIKRKLRNSESCWLLL